MTKYVLAALPLLMSVGCMRPYDVPEYEEIANNETAFMLPLEGDTSQQKAFASEEFLERNKVAGKRVQITHRWDATGHMPGSGRYLPTVKLVKVSRAAVTRTWTKEATTGTSSRDESIKVESRDSINFSVGYSVTAQIPEASTAKFLYRYGGATLPEVMDSEVRTRITKATQEFCADYDMDQLRTKKAELLKAVIKDVTDYYKDRGVEVTAVAMVGGFSYDNPKIQEAIDAAMQAQQLQVVAEAKLKAAETDRKTAVVKAEAEGEAEAARVRKVVEANKYAVEQLKDDYLKLRQLEVQEKFLEKWTGNVPTMMAGGQGFPLLMTLPMPDKK